MMMTKNSGLENVQGITWYFWETYVLEAVKYCGET